MKLVLNRPSDLIARFGGEEFIAILPETEHEGALQVAEHIRQAVIDLEIPHIASNNDYVTVSIGIATARPVQLLNFEKLVTTHTDAGSLIECRSQNKFNTLKAMVFQGSQHVLPLVARGLFLNLGNNARDVAKDLMFFKVIRDPDESGTFVVVCWQDH